MNRKSFLRKSTSLLAGVAVGGIPMGLSKKNPQTLSVLHTNDTLGYVDPLPASKYKGRGGMNSRAALIKELRAKAEAAILLDAGSAFGNTPYTDVHGQRIIYDMMSEIGYDAATLGRTEINAGRQTLVDAAESAEFPIVISNYRFSSDKVESCTRRYTVIKRKQLRIGIFGLGEDLKSCKNKRMAESIEVRNPRLVAEAMVRKLRYQMECDLVICLSRLGLKSKTDQKISDLRLARQVGGIDMIIGGPDQKFMDSAEIVNNSTGTDTAVSQAGYGGAMLGRTTFEYERKTGIGKIFSSNHSV
jgi:5'-nucleotidase